jgi:hypothetical protein
VWTTCFPRNDGCEEATVTVVDLRDVPLATLARVQAAIGEMRAVLKQMSSDSPNRYLVIGLLKSLRSNEARLKAGVRRRPRDKKQ